MFYRPREDGVGEAREGAGEVVLGITQGLLLSFCAGDGGGGEGVGGFEVPGCPAEGAELDGDACADAEKGRQCAFVEGEGAFFCVDALCRLEGGVVLGRCLETDFYDVEGLACVCSS